MSTRRERLERKLEKREEWAEKADARSDSAYKRARDLGKHIPLGQPILVGHHSEKRHRAHLKRMDSAARKSCEEHSKASHHRSKAVGLERQLKTSIFSDDDNAVKALREKIDTLDAKRKRMRRINAAHKAFVKDPAALDLAKWADLTEEERTRIRRYEPAYSWEPHPFPPYSFQNVGGRISQAKKRITAIEAQRERAEKAESNGGVVIEGDKHVRVTFAEKPDRSVLTALKDNGFRWGGGSWVGDRGRIPSEVLALASE